MEGTLEALWEQREKRVVGKLAELEQARERLDRAFENDDGQEEEARDVQREFDRLNDELAALRMETTHFSCLRRKPGQKSVWQEIDLCCEKDSRIVQCLITLSSEPSLPPPSTGGDDLPAEGASIWPHSFGSFQILLECRPKRYISELVKICAVQMDPKVEGPTGTHPAPKGTRRFRLSWRDGSSDDLYSEHFAEIEETLGMHMNKFKRRKVARVKHVTVLWGLQRIPYDKTNEGHERELLKLWEAYSPDVPLNDRISDQWKEMGFQGKDPATDFRGMGLLGLTLLNFMAEHRIADMRAILARRQDYPFAAAAINIASLLFEKLGFSAKVDLEKLYHSSSEFQTPLMDFFCRVDDEFVFEEVFVVLMLILDSMFAYMKAGYMDFPAVLKRVAGMFDELMQLHVVSIDQLRFLAEQRIQVLNKLAPF